MNLISNPGNPLSGSVSLPGDKSLSHRAALLAGLAGGQSRIENFLVSGVTQAMLEALTALGVSWELQDRELRVFGRGISALQAPEKPIDCGNSATTLRLLAGALSMAGTAAVLDGSPGLRSRPMGRIVEPLQSMGVKLAASARGTAPLELASRPAGQRLSPIDYSLPVASAQVKSCLLLAALAADAPCTLREPGPSRDHTERMLRGLGISVESRPDESVPGSAAVVTTLYPPSPAVLPPLNIALPGDISSAAFLIVAALITPESEITLCNVGLNPTRTGLLDALKMMGADIRVNGPTEYYGEPVGEITVRYSKLTGIQVRGPLVVRMIDEFPAFAVAACFAQGSTEVSEAAELRHKESDRIGAICRELAKIGGQIRETEDGFIIQGEQKLRGGAVETHGDHRLAMALAVAGLAAQRPVKVQGAEMIRESFPGFVETLWSLGADLGIKI